jgi:FtsP/CotA-like multicopper oxidase with cupredoxin domain
MDGVPGISFAGIPPGETFTYRFKVQQSGSYWYHSHSGMQELTGMYGAIIIDPAGPETIRADRDHVVLFSDWTDEDPMRVFAKLKVQGDYYNYNQPTVFDFFRDASRDGVSAALDKRKMWNEMRMNPTDLADLFCDPDLPRKWRHTCRQLDCSFPSGRACPAAHGQRRGQYLL